MKCINFLCDCHNKELSNQCDIHNWAESKECETRKRYNRIIRKSEIEPYRYFVGTKLIKENIEYYRKNNAS